jgi:O-antigen ligase
MPTSTNPLTAWASEAGRWLGQFGTRPRFLALAGFLFAGDLKANPKLAWIPVDLTALGAGLLIVVILARVMRGWRTASPWPLLLVALWFATFIPGVTQAVASDYGSQKILTLFSLTLLAAVAPIFLVEEEEDLRRLVNALMYFCLLITAEGMLVVSGPVRGPRLEVFGAGTIALGRAAGLLFAYAVTLLLQDSPMPALTFVLMALAGMVAFFSGSRGPIVAGLAGIGVLVAFGRQALGRTLPRLAVAGGLFFLVLASSISLAPEGSLSRVESFARGDYGPSEQYRVQALKTSWSYIPEAPLGLGWGGFATYVNPLNGMGRQYSHNLLAEVTLESGWVSGAYTLLLLVFAAVAGWSRTRMPGGQLIFIGLLFYAINAMVSGDINDNRPLFMFVTAAIMLLDLPRVQHG